MKRESVFKITSIAIGIVVSFIAAELILRAQNFIELDGFSNQSPWNDVLHHGSDEFVITEYGSNCTGEKIKLLLLGDSWMQDGYPLNETIGEALADKSGKCVQAFNGGTSSYAPTIYLLKGRQAFERYGKFDYVIVNIDETDVGDEWVRYRVPSVLNASGKIVAVPFDNDLHSVYLWNGKLWAENSKSYVVRLVKFTFFYKVLVPMLYKLKYSPDYPTLMQYVMAPDARSVFGKEIKYFDRKVLALVEEIASYTDGTDHVYITHHPHLRGLIDRVDEGKLYLPIVSEALARLKKKTEVVVLDARSQIGQIHGEAFPLDTFQENDPFYHLNNGGEIRYGKWIAAQIELE
jgi:hypothetical protein